MFWLLVILGYFLLASISLGIFAHFEWVDTDMSGSTEFPTAFFACVAWPIAWIVFLCIGVYMLTRHIIENYKFPDFLKIKITK